MNMDSNDYSVARKSYNGPNKESYCKLKKANILAPE